MRTHKFTCSQCKKNITHNCVYTTGYGTDSQGNKICFSCCGKNDRQQMIKEKKITLYFTPLCTDLPQKIHGKCTVTNWPSTLSLNGRYKKGRHNIAQTRYDIWFNFNGYEWHGVTYGDNTQLCHCRQTKTRL